MPERLRQRVLRCYPTCWLAVPGRCTVTSTEVHHITDDADGGQDVEFNSDGTPQLVGVCGPCHSYVSAKNSSARGGRPGSRVLREPERRPNR
ncbi:hypothetical protein BH10ACT9_BH10ACT9_58210 [soil metagenome]